MPSCAVCKKLNSNKQCSRCKFATYCSVECQTSAWKAGHKQTCGKAAPPASASESEDEDEAEDEGRERERPQDVWQIPGSLTDAGFRSRALSDEQHCNVSYYRRVINSGDGRMLFDLVHLEDGTIAKGIAPGEGDLPSETLRWMAALYWLGTLHTLNVPGRLQFQARLATLPSTSAISNAISREELNKPYMLSDETLDALCTDLLPKLSGLVYNKLIRTWKKWIAIREKSVRVERATIEIMKAEGSWLEQGKRGSSIAE